MPKRNRSFDEDYIQQSKMFVNDKIISENDSLKMDNIYENTMQLLVNGAKNESKGGVLRDNNVLDSKNQKEKSQSLNTNFRQMFISKDGKLQSSGVIKSPKSANCKLCTTGIACKFCEELQCNNCGVYCKKCKEFFCRKCSVDLYEESNGHICLSCA